MNFEEYTEKQELYLQFSKVVKRILLSAINTSSSNGGYEYHLQQIQNRAKDVLSLENKLQKDDYKDNDKNRIEDFVTDLAGCRIIFYYNDDVTSFLNSGIIHDNFKVEWEKSKVFGPTDAPESANDYYTANHFTVELDDQRAALAEYSKFKGLKCEIQIHTILNHAYSETMHDITYKEQNTSNGYGKRIQDSINKRLKKIMESYLKPAGVEFQKILYDQKRLSEGKVLFDRDLEKEIESCEDNNQRFDLLEQFLDYTLPNCDGEYIDKNIEPIVNIVKIAINSSRNVDPISIETHMGVLEGKEFKDIVKTGLKILNYIQYVNKESVELVFSYLIELSFEGIEEDKVNDAVENLAKYRISILQNNGFVVQEVILDILEKLDATQLKKIKTFTAKICRTLLNSSAEDTSSTYQTLTLSRGSIPGNKASEIIRRRALDILKDIYDTSDPNNVKQNIISAFNEATRTPSSSNYNCKLLSIILQNSKDIVEFYTSVIDSEDYHILESIEEDISFLYRRSKGIIERNSAEYKDCHSDCEVLIDTTLIFREELNNDKEFVIYKTLVGFESVFEESWDNVEWDVREKSEYRDKQAESFLNQITEETKEYWENLLIRCATTESNDLATFPHFNKFLNVLSEKNPDFIIQLIKKNEELFCNFIIPILDGLLKSSESERTISIMNEWIKEGKHLSGCARVFEYFKPLNKQLLKSIFSTAKLNKDSNSLVAVMVAASKGYVDNNDKSLIKEYFIPSLRELTTLEQAGWVHNFWFRREFQNIASVLSKDDIDLLLNNLLSLPRIDHQVEEILAPVAKAYPNKIINFFQSRLLQEDEDGKIISAFDAIPFSFYKLHEILSQFPDVVIDSICKWYDGNYSSFIYRGGRLIHNIFSNFPEELENKLISLVETGKEENILIVTAILRNYDGDPVIKNVCRTIVETLPDDSDLISEVMAALENTGVLTGEFGWVEACKQKIQEVTKWKNDNNPKVKAFAKKYISGLKMRMVSEQRRAEEMIELRKHKYGEDENEK